jgi:DUF1009 family protein
MAEYRCRLPMHWQLHGRECKVVAIRGEADAATRSLASAELGWGEIGRLYAFLNKSGCRDVLLIGGVSKRPDLLPFWVIWARSAGCRPLFARLPAVMTAC